jgi:hypothetical protein
MRYWDASALVSLCVAEEDTARPGLPPAGSRPEPFPSIASAIERRARRQPGSRRARARIAALADRGVLTEIAALVPVQSELSAWSRRT